MSDIAIKAEGLSKYYKLGVINNGTFFKDVQTWMARKAGKEDPNAQIGSKYDPTAEGFWALKDLNFEIKQGDRVGIIGKNGAGKSTLLKVLSRVTAPTEGDVKIKGRIASLLEVGTGFHQELTGRENIYLNGAILGMKRREVDRKIDEIIAFSEIEKHIDTPVKRYSSGMYVRLAFAVAAHLDSEILIADEVLAVGDAAFQKKAIGKMNELSTGQGRTVLFVSHNMGAVSSLCNSGMVLHHGQLLLQSDLDECKTKYLLLSNGMEDTKNNSEWCGEDGDENILMRYASVSAPNSESADVSFFRGTQLNLDVEFEVLKENPSYVYCVEIYNRSTGNKLIECSATEFLNNRIDEITRVGKHKLAVQIDTSILAQGEYFIKFDWSIRDVKKCVSDDVSLSFSIEDDDKEGTVFIPHRSNIISPVWSWRYVYD